MLLAISATFTAEAIQPALAFWMRELGLSDEIRFAAYNQVFQELLDPAGLLARNAGGVNVVLVCFDDWPAAGAAEFVDAVRAAAGRMTVPLIVVLCPGTAQFDEEVRRGASSTTPSGPSSPQIPAHSVSSQSSAATLNGGATMAWILRASAVAWATKYSGV